MPVKALQKWAAERVGLRTGPAGRVEATFRFDGSTCSNLGHPLAFDYRVRLRRLTRSFLVEAAECVPADAGYEKMCAALKDPDGFRRILALDQPTPGRRLEDLLALRPPVAPSGCLCTPENRAHKWRLALETISFALSPPAGAPAGPSP